VALLGDLDKDFTFYAVKEIPTGQLALSDCWKRALWIEMRLVKATGTAPDVTIEQAWPMHTAVVLGDCDAVTGMLPSPPNPNYNLRMAGAVPAPGGCTGGLACTDGFDLAVCFPSSETTGVPMVTLRNRRPPPPGLPVTYPTQSAAGVVTQNSVP